MIIQNILSKCRVIVCEKNTYTIYSIYTTSTFWWNLLLVQIKQPNVFEIDKIDCEDREMKIGNFYNWWANMRGANRMYSCLRSNILR